MRNSDTSSSAYIEKIKAQNIITAVASGGRSGTNGSFKTSTSINIGSILSVADLPEDPLIAPTDLVVTSVDDISAQISWVITSNIVTGSKIEYKVSTSDVWIPITVPGSSETYTFTGLISNTVYNIRVTSVNNTRFSRPSASINLTTPLARPTDLSAYNIQATQLNLVWVDNVGDIITSYDIEYSPFPYNVKFSKNIPYNPVTGPISPPRPEGPTDTISGLSSSVLYKIIVRTNTSSSRSAFSNPLFVASSVSVPIYLTAGIITPTTVDLTWTDTVAATNAIIEYSSNSGSSWTAWSQTTQYSSTPGSSWLVWPHTTPITNGSATVTGLSIETLYSFRVATVTALGRSNYSVPLTNIITAPAAATDLSFNSPTLSWRDNSTTGTNVNLYYKVTGSSAAYTRISAVIPGYIAGGNKTLNITAPTLSSLPSGVNLTVQIRVVSSGKESSASNTISNVLRPGTLIQPPTGLTLSNITATSVDLSWNTVTTDLSSSIVEYKKDTESSWTTINGVTGSTRAITGLDSGVLYNFRVSSVKNSGAVSAPSTVISGSTVALSVANWVAGGNGSNTLAWSDDGKVWENSNDSTNIFSGWGNNAKWNGSLWVAGGKGSSNKTIAWSDDGKVWNTATGSPFLDFCNTVAWSSSQSLWVAGGGGSSNIAWSDDGKSWTAATSSPFNDNCISVEWNGSIWVAGGAGSSNIAWSNDGKSWNAATGSPFNTFCTGVVWNGSMWVARGIGSSSKLAWSNDGKVWNAATGSLIINVMNTVAWSSSQSLWVAGGSNGGTNSLIWSTDGKAWNAATGSIFYNTCITIKWNGSLWVAGGRGTSSIIWSNDGKDWTTTSSPLNLLCTRLVWNGSLWVAGGEDNQDHALAWSEDGKDWTGLGKSNFTSTFMIAAK